MNRQTLLCPIRSELEPSLSSSSEPLAAAETSAFVVHWYRANSVSDSV